MRPRATGGDPKWAEAHSGPQKHSGENATGPGGSIGQDPDAFRLEEADAEVQKERERDALIIKAQTKLGAGKTKKETDTLDG